MKYHEATFLPDGESYGVEIEAMALRESPMSPWGYCFAPIRGKTLEKLNRIVAAEGAFVDHDATVCIIEINLRPRFSLLDVIESAHLVIAKIAQVLAAQGIFLWTTGWFPFGNITDVYDYLVEEKLLYSLLRGCLGPSIIPPQLLKLVFPTAAEPEFGRKILHPHTLFSCSSHLWYRSLRTSDTASQVASLQATGFFFNLVGANSPFSTLGGSDDPVAVDVPAARDYRLSAWESWVQRTQKADEWSKYIDGTVYKEDHLLVQPLQHLPLDLVHYYQQMLELRPFTIPDNGMYKETGLPLVQPDGEFTYFDLLTGKEVEVVDLTMSGIKRLKPPASIMFDSEGFYWGNARVRTRVRYPERINPLNLARLVQEGDEPDLQALLKNIGATTFVEGRIHSQALPNTKRPTWASFDLPIVLQAAFMRRSKEILGCLLSSFSWRELTGFLQVTNTKGFSAHLRDIPVLDIVQDLLPIIRAGLTNEEYSIIEDELTLVLEQREAQAERQILWLREAQERYPVDWKKHFIESLLFSPPSE